MRTSSIIVSLSMIVSFILPVTTHAQHSLRYVQARIEWSTQSELLRLIQQPIAWEDGIWKKGNSWEGPLSETELHQLQKAGFEINVLIDDLSRYYIERNQQAIQEQNATTACSLDSFYGVALPDPIGFTLGSMGGYFTLQQIYEHLDSMHARFPDLISAKQPIDTFLTHEGRPIYFVKISDHPDSNESEPAILLTALHHAREPASASQLIYFMYTLLENYNSHPVIQWLVDHSEIYIIPCINPDGYYYNQTTFPQGGGMWRKNRRNNGDGTYGVDLNRNYGFHWGYNNTGSSPVTSSQVYRGPAPFSEPETQAVRFLCNQDSFRIALNYHTYSNLLIYPWGFAHDSLTPDSNYYKALAAELVKYNRYLTGTGDQTVGYIVNGDSDDWMYGDTSKPKIFAMTPEVGSPSQGFWPPSSDILSLCRQTRWMNLAAIMALHNYAALDHAPPTLINSSTGQLKYHITPIGLASDSIVIVFRSLSPHWSIDTTPRIYNASVAQTVVDSVGYSMTNIPPAGTLLKYAISRSFGNYQIIDTFSTHWGNPITIFADTFHSLQNHWSTTHWQLTNATYHSPPYSITESPFGNYPNNTIATLELDTPISLMNASLAYLSFYARWDLEPNYDFVYIQVRPTSQTSWHYLCSPRMTPATPPGYSGLQTDWIKETIDLSDWIGNSLKIRFLFVSDAYVQADGFYLDDISIQHINSTPTYQASPLPPPALQVKAMGPSLTIWKPAEAGELQLYTIQGAFIARKNSEDNSIVHWQIPLNPGGYLMVFRGQRKFATKLFFVVE